eukprot:6126147-Pleurochrysis_carterae.AAC.1
MPSPMPSPPSDLLPPSPVSPSLPRPRPRLRPRSSSLPSARACASGGSPSVSLPTPSLDAFFSSGPRRVLLGVAEVLPFAVSAFLEASTSFCACSGAMEARLSSAVGFFFGSAGLGSAGLGSGSLGSAGFSSLEVEVLERRRCEACPCDRFFVRGLFGIVSSPLEEMSSSNTDGAECTALAGSDEAKLGDSDMAVAASTGADESMGEAVTLSAIPPSWLGCLRKLATLRLLPRRDERLSDLSDLSADLSVDFCNLSAIGLSLVARSSIGVSEGPPSASVGTELSASECSLGSAAACALRAAAPPSLLLSSLALCASASASAPLAFAALREGRRPVEAPLVAAPSPDEGQGAVASRAGCPRLALPPSDAGAGR